MRTLLVLAFVLVTSACDDPQSVGNLCVLAHPSVGSAQVIETPALDCSAKMCLQMAETQPALCTADCGSVGDACTPESTADCEGGRFRCEVPFLVGPFAGRKLCVCGAYFDEADARP
jgi:hypothetical protein